MPSRLTGCVRCSGQREFKGYMNKASSKPYTERLADFHVLLWLSGQGNLDLHTDIAALAEAVRDQAPIQEGYKLIIDSLASS